jgi:hypothetical protein
MRLVLPPILLLLALSASTLLTNCSQQPDPAPKLDYDQASQELMQTLAPQVVGTWTLRHVQVSFQPYNPNHALLPLRGDTLFQNLATLTLATAKTPRNARADARYPEFEGQLHFRGQDYPVYLQLLAYPNQVVNHQGPQAYFLLETNYPVGSRQRDAGEEWLTNLGLLDDNYTLELAAGQPLMHWRGLGRGVSRIDLVK